LVALPLLMAAKAAAIFGSSTTLPNRQASAALRHSGVAKKS